jgi:hypothetical protein
MNLIELSLYITLVILTIIIIYNVFYYNYKESIESFGSDSDDPALTGDNSLNEPPFDPSMLGTLPDLIPTPTPTTTTNQNSTIYLNGTGLPNYQCIAKLKLSSPLQGCSTIANKINTKIPNYSTLFNNLSDKVTFNINLDIATLFDKYNSLIDNKLDAYKVSEDTVRQQAYFKSQNGNVLNINTKYKTDLAKKTDNSKETYNIQLDLFNKAKFKDEQITAKIVTLTKYTKYIMVFLIVILLCNLLLSEFKD